MRDACEDVCHIYPDVPGFFILMIKYKKKCFRTQRIKVKKGKIGSTSPRHLCLPREIWSCVWRFVSFYRPPQWQQLMGFVRGHRQVIRWMFDVESSQIVIAWRVYSFDKINVTRSRTYWKKNGKLDTSHREYGNAWGSFSSIKRYSTRLNPVHEVQKKRQRQEIF